MPLFTTADLTELREMVTDLAMNAQCTIKRATAVDDGGGGKDTEYPIVSLVACTVKTTVGVNYVGGGLMPTGGDELGAEISLPFGSTIQAGDSIITDQSKTYRIVHVPPVGTMDMKIVVFGVERV